MVNCTDIDGWLPSWLPLPPAGVDVGPGVDVGSGDGVGSGTVKLDGAAWASF